MRTILILMLILSMMLTAACSAREPADQGDMGPGTSSEADSQKSDETALLGSFTAKDLDGNEVNQDVLKNSDLTMINIWGTFCSPCLDEMPDLGALQAEYKDKGLQIIGIVVDAVGMDGKISQEMVDLAKEIVEKTGADYLHLLPSDDLNQAKLNEVYSIPETFFVDKEGRAVGKSYSGARSKEKWRSIIEQTLKEVNG